MSMASFPSLYERWRRETAGSSIIRVKLSHPAFREIVGMGEVAIPLILDQLRRQPSHLFWALSEMTGIDPVDPSSTGTVEDVIAAWLEWGAMRETPSP